MELTVYHPWFYTFFGDFWGICPETLNYRIEYGENWVCISFMSDRPMNGYGYLRLSKGGIIGQIIIQSPCEWFQHAKLVKETE